AAGAACPYRGDTVGGWGRFRLTGSAAPQRGVVVLRTSNVACGVRIRTPHAARRTPIAKERDMLRLATPWALVLLLLLPATAALGYARLQRLPGRRGPIALAMRLAAVALLVGALAGPQWRLLERRGSGVLPVHASARVGAAGQRSGMEWAARAVPAAGPLDRAGLVRLGAG